jgi:hypothetical protein
LDDHPLPELVEYEEDLRKQQLNSQMEWLQLQIDKNTTTVDDEDWVAHIKYHFSADDFKSASPFLES